MENLIGKGEDKVRKERG